MLRRPTLLTRAGSNLGLQRAGTLPLEERELRHAATMPITHDLVAERPCWGGMWKFQQFLGFLLGITAMVVCCVVRPIKDRHCQPANEMLGIMLLCGFFWVFEALPIYITSLLPLILIPFCRFSSADTIAGAYWNTIQMLFVATYLVEIALEVVNLPRRATLKLLLHVGVVRPWLLLLSFMVVCWFLSMFINAIAVTLMISPFALGLMRAAEEGSVEDPAGEAEQGSVSEEGDVVNKIKEIEQFSRGLLLGIAYSATAGGMATLTGSIPNRVLMGTKAVSADVNWTKWFFFAFPISLATLLLAYITVYLRYVRRLKYVELTRDILELEYEELLKQIGPLNRDEVAVGLIQLLQIILFIIEPWAIAPYFTNQYGVALVSDGCVACIPAVLLFLVPSVVRPGQPVLTWVHVSEKLDFGLLLLIGGGFAISKGFEESGLDLAAGAWFSTLTESLSPFQLTLMILFVGSVTAQLFSQVGTATSMLPVISSVALDAMRNPLQLELPTAISCSFAFVLPTAAAGNIVVLAKSQELAAPLHVRDFVSTGLPLNVAAIAVGAVLVHFLGQAVFHSHMPFPMNACGNGASNCIWLPIPGLVGDIPVTAQACMVLDEYKGKMCRLWNHTLLPLNPAEAGVVAPPEPEEDSEVEPIATAEAVPTPR